MALLLGITSRVGATQVPVSLTLVAKDGRPIVDSWPDSSSYHSWNMKLSIYWGEGRPTEKKQPPHEAAFKLELPDGYEGPITFMTNYSSPEQRFEFVIDAEGKVSPHSFVMVIDGMTFKGIEGPLTTRVLVTWGPGPPAAVHGGDDKPPVAVAFEDKTGEWCGKGDGGGGTASFGDFNDDGFVDVATGSGIWLNAGGRKFRNIGGGGGAVIWGDVNNDGHLDRAQVSGPGPIRLGDGKGGFEVGPTPPGPFGAECVAASWGDIDNDGLLDIYYGGGSGHKDTLWRQDPEHEEKWVKAAEAGGAYARSVVGCDFDEDNDIDFYVSNYWLVSNWLWVSDGKGGSSNRAGEFGAQGGNGHSVGACWGDMDNDGYLDIFAGNFAHRGQPQSRFLRNTGPVGKFTFRDKGPCGVGYQESYASPTLGDCDNDGDLDLFFTTVYGHNAARLYRNNGNWSFSDVTAEAGLGGLKVSYQAAWADVDNDGDLDLMTKGKLFINKGNENHWLKIRLKGDGKTVNTAAIGARVRIKLGDETLTRQVEGGGVGQGNQNDLTLHFGLGRHKEKVKYEVTWTNGAKQEGETGIDRMIRVEMKTGK